MLGQVKWPDFVAGITGGAVATVILHPLDLAKIRLQVNEGTGIVSCRPKSQGFIQTLVDVVKYRGPGGLYLGLTPNLIGASGSWGFYFFLYAALKSHCQAGDSSKVLPTVTYLGCGALAGSLTLTIMNPIWVVKTRLCLQYERLAQSAEQSLLTHHAQVNLVPGSQIKSVSTWEALANLWRYEGMVGLYKGYLPGLLGVSHGAIQFTLYELMRNRYNQHYRSRPSNSKLTSLEYLTFASASKLIAAFLTYPYQVVRSRMQDQHRQYNGLLHVIRELWRGEGVMGFYKGLVPNLLRVTPACAITFLVYEQTVDFLKSPHRT
ncbi:Mitochondrial folate transporter/carrier [Paragonimus heterotremus]|uniref:Mitochondrial folate transporter/carrier n=1 Tax=Paragonimus heterotremus TaxID=100268 RepID=A0A8J4T5Y6_9TREM|nr:Mitochondrial folate transporter/carrier [Paragonimus heterotremus]